MGHYVSVSAYTVLFFSYIIKDTICALALCEHQFPRKVAFAYLDDIASEFLSQNAHKVDTVTRPYHFLDFGIIY